MPVSLEELEDYLGCPVADMLADVPFKNWAFIRTVETDLDELRIDYEFPVAGMDVVCDENDVVETIFLYADDERTFHEGLEDFPLSLTRKQVNQRLGRPSRSGEGGTIPILGERGAWDQFKKKHGTIHVEFRVNSDRINKITLMRADVVP